MSLRLVQVSIKAADPEVVGRFWADALGWAASPEGPDVVTVEPPGFTWPDPTAVCVDVVRVPDPTVVRHRAHLDLATTSPAHHAALVARLRSLGATPADVGQGDVPWTVLADPGGTVFCVLEPRPEYLDTGPVAAVVVHCADPRALAAFWSAATGWRVHQVTDVTARLRAPEGVGPYLELVRADDADAVRTRVHLDLLPDPVEEQAAEVARLETLGARRADVGQGDVPWVVLTDPEGDPFCVLGRG